LTTHSYAVKKSQTFKPFKMKKTAFAFTGIVMMTLLLTAFKPAAENAKVTVIVNKAAWCSICNAHAGRTVANFTENNKDNFFHLIVNDITSDETKKTSSAPIAKAGLQKAAASTLAAGVLSFYDAKTKKLLAQVTVANTDEELAAVMKMVRSKIAE
jgi:hypothetical protein